LVEGAESKARNGEKEKGTDGKGKGSPAAALFAGLQNPVLV